MTYQTREEWLNAFIDAARSHFERVNAPLPPNIRVAVGFTSRGLKGAVVGEVWSDKASDDGHFEVFVKPTLTERPRICSVLTQQLIRAAVGIDKGCNAHFKRVAMSLGLTGTCKKGAELHANSDWYTWALPIMTQLGEMPYAPITADGISTARPKQNTALLKVECPVCGWLARSTRKHIAPHSHLRCPVPECIGELYCEDVQPEPDDE